MNRIATVFHLRRGLAGLALCLLVAGCSTYKAQRTAHHAEERGNWDEAVGLYLELLADDPGNLEYRAGLVRTKIAASREHFARARSLHEAGELEASIREYRLAVELDPSNDYAGVELRKALEELSDRRSRASGEQTLEELKRQTSEAREQPPMLNPRSNEPIDLNFPNPVSTEQIYEALGRGFGINIIFDQALKSQNITLQLQQVRARDALEMVMRAAGHFYKVLDATTILVADDTPPNRQKYEDLLIQTFYLSNADPKALQTVIRGLIGSRNIAANEDLNAIVLRDSADKVRVAERVIQANDKARGEVIVDVELIQIDATVMQELGVSLSNYQLGQSLDEAALPIRMSGAERIGHRANWLLSVPSVLYEFMKSETDVQFLARPQVRISDGEKATLHIGDRVPIPVTSFNTGSTIGGNIIPITSFQYQDIGIRIELEPRIHHNDEITLQLKVEVSNLAGNVPGSQGQQQPIISTRTIESTIRLHDGETNLLAGLIQTRDRGGSTGVPGVSEIPVLGKLFSRNESEKARTDLVLTLTPHIIRTADITEQDLQPIWVGTEQNITFRGGSPRLESGADGPFEEPTRSPEEIRELIRERLERLQNDPDVAAEEQAAEEAEASGLDLGGGRAPGDIFGRDDEPDPGEPPAEPTQEYDPRLQPPRELTPDLGTEEDPSNTAQLFAPRDDVTLWDVLVAETTAGSVPASATRSISRPLPPLPADGPAASPPASSAAAGAVAADRPPAAGSEDATVPVTEDEGGPQAALRRSPSGGLNVVPASWGAPPAGRTRRPAGEAGRAPGAETGRRGVVSRSAPAAGVRLGLVASTPRPHPGGEFEVEVQVAAGVPVSHLPLTLDYDPERLELLAVTAGEFLGTGGEASLMTDGSVPGQLVLGASRLGEGPGASGHGVVARLRFRALGAGGTSIRFREARARDAGLESIDGLTVEDLSLHVGGRAPLPPRQERSRRPEV